MVALVSINTIEVGLEERPVDDTGWNARSPSQRGPERLEIGAVAGAEGQAVGGTADRRGVFVLGVFYPVLDVVEYSVIKLAGCQDGVGLIADDLMGELTDLIIDLDMLVGCQIRGKLGAVGLRQRFGFARIDVRTHFIARHDKGLDDLQLFVFWVGGLEIEDLASLRIALDAIRIWRLDL